MSSRRRLRRRDRQSSRDRPRRTVRLWERSDGTAYDDGDGPHDTRVGHARDRTMEGGVPHVEGTAAQDRTTGGSHPKTKGTAERVRTTGERAPSRRRWPPGTTRPGGRTPRQRGRRRGTLGPGKSAPRRRGRPGRTIRRGGYTPCRGGRTRWIVRRGDATEDKDNDRASRYDGGTPPMSKGTAPRCWRWQRRTGHQPRRRGGGTPDHATGGMRPVSTGHANRGAGVRSDGEGDDSGKEHGQKVTTLRRRRGKSRLATGARASPSPCRQKRGRDAKARPPTKRRERRGRELDREQRPPPRKYE